MARCSFRGFESDICVAVFHSQDIILSPFHRLLEGKHQPVCQQVRIGRMRQIFVIDRINVI